MKTKFYFLPILLLGGLSLFTACSDDDDEKGGGQPSGPVIGPSGTNSGARLTSISAGWGKTTYFQYNEDGTVQHISERYDMGVVDEISMTYNPFRIETKDNGFLKPVQVEALKNQSNLSNATQHTIITILNEALPKKSTAAKVSLSEKKLDKYFPPHFSAKEREEVIISLLEQWSQANDMIE